ncbi:MAG: adenine deaminase [Actinomycetes bacterium]
MARPPVSLHALAAARGDVPADILLKGGRVLSPTTREWVTTDLAIADGVVVGWGERDAHEVINVDGASLVAGFVDAHMHLESSKLWVDEYVKAVLPNGTTAVAADPHEIANVAGLEGIRALVDAAEKMPFTFGVAASSCVPASPFESAGAAFSAADVKTIIDELGAIGVAEVMNYPAVINGDPMFRDIIASAGWRKVDGHAPGLRGRALDAYLAAGIESDHECFALDEAHEKRQKGMWVFLRQGSVCQDLLELLPTVLSHGPMCTAFCSDDREPDLLRDEGHINHCLRLAVEGGLNEIDALIVASFLPAMYHNFFHLGQLGPGYQADVAVFDTLQGFKPSLVLQRGKVVARNGVIEPGAVPVLEAPQSLYNRVRLHHVPTAAELTIDEPTNGRARVIGVTSKTVRTKSLILDVSDAANDIARIAVVERHKATGRIGLAYVSGYGIQRGAIASTVAHDAHNIMVVGARDASGPADMSLAIARVAEMGGGQVVVVDGKVVAEVALPIAGLMSPKPLLEVAGEIDRVVEAARELGITLDAPFMALSFLGLSVIPDLRITDHGLIDVNEFAVVPVSL